MFYAPSGTGPSLKLHRLSGEYRASNVMFNPKTMEATSFEWWYFVKRIGGKVVFNNYSYSSYTSRHQRKVERCMRELGIKVDVTIEAPKGLQDLIGAVSWHEDRIKALIGLIQKPGTRAAKNAERAAQVVALQKRVEVIRDLIKREERDDADAA